MAAAVTFQRPGLSGAGSLGLVVVLALAGVLAIPLSQHAAQSHRNDIVNAEGLAKRIGRGECKPMTCFWCPQEQTIKVLCGLSDHTMGGLIVADDLSTIITGYPARPSYWKSNVSGCVPMPCSFP